MRRPWLAAGATQAHAVPLPIGGNVNNPPEVMNLDLGANFKILADTGFKDFTTTEGGVTGQVREIVVSGDPNNKAGGLDFIYQVNNNFGSNLSINALDMSRFDNFSTDVEQAVQTNNLPFVKGSVKATSADRTVSGNRIIWHFGGFSAGNNSDILIVRTDAPQFRTGNIGVMDAANGVYISGGFFAPTLPEPSSLVLLGSCLAGLGGAGAWRRWRKGTLALGAEKGTA